MNADIRNSTETISYQQYASYIAFFILIFISFFGTGAPFPDRYEAVEDIATSNIFNQIIYLFIFSLAFYSIYNRKRDLLDFIKREKFLSLLILWYFLGIIWSVDPFSTFKLSFRLLIIAVVSIAFFINFSNYTSADKILKNVAALFVLVNIILVLTITGATDPSFGTWRGNLVTKNVFGQVTVLAFIVGVDIYLREKTKQGKVLVSFIIILSALLLFGSQSSTSIITFLAFIALISVTIIDRTFNPIGIGRFLSTSLLVAILSTILLILNLFPSFIEDFVSLFGKDTTFTGRTDLWFHAMLSIEKHFPIGTGIGAFWNAANKDLALVHVIFPWLPMQFHNAFLDIWNEAGIIGFIFFIALCTKYLWRSWQYRKHNIWFYFIIAVFILSSQESTLSGPGSLVTTLFYMGYIRVNFQNNEGLKGV